MAASRPLVYVYDFMDGLHRELVCSPEVAKFFDLWHPHSQYLSEFAFHRSLVASSFVTEDPAAASFFFVPFYSRLAFELRRTNATLPRAMVAQLARGLRSSPHYRRAAGRDHMLLVSSTRPLQQLFGESLLR